ncbi:hypothetical protein [Tenacibaculum mesophilum]|uniref:Uncharacterized protein n=1 Tax=Tenacibaculum sp. Pbs-1 TaxID=3238748 RepID=A0AB33KZI3_9FLAO|nr:hypothetical protein [Tenacibaculum mesophilum]
MIEILALVFLGKKIAELAGEKGESPNKWRGIMIGSWFGAEILGIVIFASTIGIGDDTIFPAAMVGLVCGLTSYFVVRSILTSKPDTVKELS